MISGTKAWVRCDNGERKDRVARPRVSNMERGKGEISFKHHIILNSKILEKFIDFSISSSSISQQVGFSVDTI
jgi:hypothetical protein